MQAVIFVLDENAYLETYDPDAHDGRGRATFTRAVAQATRFATKGDALDCYHRQSRVRPYRPDGEPNRPLTAYTVLIDEIN